MSLISHVASYVVRPRVKHLVLHVTDKCNLRCKHCFVDQRHANTIPVPKAEGLAADLKSIFWLDIGGGEVFMLDELPDIVAPFDCEILGVPTNGHYPGRIASIVPKILRRTRARLVVVSVSIEGFREEHESIRRDKNNFDRAFESLKVLRRIADKHRRLRVKCNTVITKSNFERLTRFMRHMQDSQLIDFHSVIMVRGPQNDPNFRLPHIELLKAKRREIFEILDRYSWGGGILKGALLHKYYRLLWDVSLVNAEHHTQSIPCMGGQSHLVVWASGDVSSCELLPAVGNIFEESLPEILGGQRMKEQVKHVRQKRCYCTHNCVIFDSVFFNPSNYLRLLLR